MLPQAWRTALPEELYPTSYVVERTLAWLDGFAQRKDDAPFFLQCSFPDPHHPFTPPGRYWDMYKPADMTLPASFRIGNRPQPPHVAALQAARDAGTRIGNTQAAFAVNERETLEAIALTYGMITMIDDGIAKVLKRLDELGLAKDTVVIFTSDHGDLMGDHQLMLKGAFAYEGLTRVPFIWAEPDGARAGTRTGALAGTLDIAATMLDRARIAPYNGIQGKSVLPMMDGDAGHDGILIEYGSQRPLARHRRRDGDAHAGRPALPDHLLPRRAVGRVLRSRKRSARAGQSLGRSGGGEREAGHDGAAPAQDDGAGRAQPAAEPDGVTSADRPAPPPAPA